METEPLRVSTPQPADTAASTSSDHVDNASTSRWRERGSDPRLLNMYERTCPASIDLPEPTAQHAGALRVETEP